MTCNKYIRGKNQKAFFPPAKAKDLHLAAPLAQHDKTPSPKSGCGTAR
jgi:hypothetical protein